MVRQLLISVLGLALVATEAATAQTLPASPSPQKEARLARRNGRMLTARERRAAEAAAKAEAIRANEAALAMAAPTKANGWSGWSDDPMPSSLTTADPLTHRPNMNVSVAPGMPINQVGHGVTTDYDGRPLQRAATSTTLSSQR